MIDRALPTWLSRPCLCCKAAGRQSSANPIAEIVRTLSITKSSISIPFQNLLEEPHEKFDSSVDVRNEPWHCPGCRDCDRAGHVARYVHERARAKPDCGVSAFSAALSMACSTLLSPTMTRAACPSSMMSPNSLTSARDMPRHRWPPTPPTAAPTAAPTDRGREQDAHDGADGRTAPRPVPGGHLILVHMHVAPVVLGDHRGVVGADRARGMQVLDHVIIGPRRRLTRVGADVDENCVSLRHVLFFLSFACLVPYAGSAGSR